MTTPDTTTPEDTIEEHAASTATQVVENEPAAPEATSEAKAETETPAAETATEALEAPTAAVEEAAPVAQTVTTEAVTSTAVAAPVATETETAVAAPATPAEDEEDPQSTVFSLVTFFLAALPIIGVILNSIAVARAGKEGFDLWLARWGLALAIIETVGALLLVALGYYFGLLSVGAV